MSEKHTAEEIKAALYQANGLIRLASTLLHISPQGLRARIHRNQDLQQALTEAREQIVDKAEESLWDCLSNKEPWAVALVLKTLGKARGYVERQELTGAGGGPLIINWGDDDGADQR
jgi:hypothetical protein